MAEEAVAAIMAEEAVIIFSSPAFWEPHFWKSILPDKTPSQ